MKRLRLPLAVIFLVAVTSALLEAGPNTQWVGVLRTSGQVTVGDVLVSSGTTVLPGDVITTAERSNAWLRFRSNESIILLGDTQVALPASGSATKFELRRGSVVVDEKMGDQVQVALPGGKVLVKGDELTGAECELEADGNASTVVVNHGTAEILGMGAPMILDAGQTARVEAALQGVSASAAKITSQRVIQPQGETREFKAAVALTSPDTTSPVIPPCKHVVDGQVGNGLHKGCREPWPPGHY